MTCDPDTQKIENLHAFFEGEPLAQRQSELSVGAEDVARRQHDEAQIDAAFDELIGCDGDSDMIDDQSTVTGAAEPTYERIDHAPALTPYDKAGQRLIEAEILRDVAEPGSDDYHRAMADLVEAKRAFKLEQERSTDDGWRKRRATDEWRAGEGRDEYNASRRKVRDWPNTVTPKEVLNAMTPEERAQHDRDKNAEKVWKHGRRKAGWNAEKIQAELPGWWTRRLAKRACP